MSAPAKTKRVRVPVASDRCWGKMLPPCACTGLEKTYGKMTRDRITPYDIRFSYPDSNARLVWAQGLRNREGGGGGFNSAPYTRQDLHRRRGRPADTTRRSTTVCRGDFPVGRIART